MSRRDVTDRRDDTNSIESLIKQGKELIYQGKYDDALLILNKELAKFTDNRDKVEIFNLFFNARLNLGQFQSALDAVNGGIRHFDSYKKSKGEDYELTVDERLTLAKIHEKMAHILSILGRNKESVAEANKAIELNPESIFGYSLKAAAHKQLKQLSDAQEALQKALKVVSESQRGERDVASDLAKSYLARQSGEYDLAIKYAQYVTEAAPGFSTGHLYLASAFYSKAIREKSKDPSIKINIDNPLIQQALRAIDEALKQNETDSQSLYTKAIILESIGYISQAQDYLAEAIHISPNYLIASIALTNLKLAEGNHDAALEVIENIYTRHSDSEEVLYAKARVLTATNDFSEAEDCLERLVGMDPYNHNYFYRKGLLEATQNKYGEAIDSFKRSSDLKPDFLEAKYQLALAYVEEGRFIESIITINEILRINPLFPMVHQAKGYVLAEIASSPEGKAFEFYYKAKLDPAYAEAHPEITAMIEAGDLTNAELWFYNNITSENKESLDKTLEAELKIKAGDLDGAKELLEEALTINPRCALASYKLIKIHQQQGNQDKADKVLESIHDYDMEYVTSLREHNKSSFYKILEEDSIKSFSTALEFEPNNAMFHSSMASALGKFGKIDEMLHHTEKANELIEGEAGCTLDDTEREFIREQNHLRKELFKLVKELVEQAHNLKENLQELETSSASHFVIREAESAAAALTIHSPYAGLATPIASFVSHARNASTLEAGASSAISLSNLADAWPAPTNTTTSSGGGGGGGGGIYGSPHAVPTLFRVSSVDTSTVPCSLSLSLDEPASGGGGGSGGGRSMATAVLSSGSTVVAREVSRERDLSIKGTAAAQTAVETLHRASNNNSSLEELQAMLESLSRTVMDLKAENDSLKAKVHEIEGDTTFARAHNAELAAYEAQQKEVEDNPLLLEYYSGLVNTMQKMYVGFMARMSEEVEGAAGFEIPGRDYIPIPPIFSEIVDVIAGVASKAIDIRSENQITKALASSPNSVQFINEVIPRVAAKLAVGVKKELILGLREEEDKTVFGRISGAIDTLKSRIFEPEHTSIHAEMGAEDAMKILAGMKLGLIKIDRLTGLSNIADGVIVTITSSGFSAPIEVAESAPVAPPAIDTNPDAEKGNPLLSGTSASTPIDSTHRKFTDKERQKLREKYTFKPFKPSTWKYACKNIEALIDLMESRIATDDEQSVLHGIIGDAGDDAGVLVA